MGNIGSKPQNLRRKIYKFCLDLKPLRGKTRIFQEIMLIHRHFYENKYSGLGGSIYGKINLVIRLLGGGGEN